MVARDGGIFPFGDAGGHGSTGNIHLNQPVVGMAPTPSGRGYWLVASDGGIFPFGDAAALGSASALRSVAAVAPTPTGAGYWAVSSDGALAAFGDAADLGHPTGTLSRPIVGLAVLPAGASGAVPGTPADSGAGPVPTPRTTVPTP